MRRGIKAGGHKTPRSPVSKALQSSSFEAELRAVEKVEPMCRCAHWFGFTDAKARPHPGISADDANRFWGIIREEENAIVQSTRETIHIDENIKKMTRN